jgi:hypothetical protein
MANNINELLGLTQSSDSAISYGRIEIQSHLVVLEDLIQIYGEGVENQEIRNICDKISQCREMLDHHITVFNWATDRLSALGYRNSQ